MDQQSPVNQGTPPTRLQMRVLALLLLAYVFNFLDRQILAILKIPIKAELGLTDTQLGLMGGIAFASVYSTLAIPFARYADRGRRVKVIAAAITVWSGFTALCGWASSFWQLFLARMGVGVGEAGGVAPSYALIADYFPPASRARALAVFSLGIPIGSAIGLYFGGWIATALDWRWAFTLIGLAGIPVALALWLLIPEPERGALDDIEAARDEPRVLRGDGLSDEEAELLAAELRRGLGLDLRLWTWLLAAFLLRHQPGSGARRAGPLLRHHCPGRRHVRYHPRRLDWRQDRRSTTGLLCVGPRRSPSC